MSEITHDEQHDGRSAVLKLAGLILSIRKQKRMTRDEYKSAVIYLKTIGKIFDDLKDRLGYIP
jgi:hypothetical protein